MRSVGAVYDVSWTVSESPGSGYQNFCKKLIAWQFQPLRAACSYIFISDATVLICREEGPSNIASTRDRSICVVAVWARGIRLPCIGLCRARLVLPGWRVCAGSAQPGGAGAFAVGEAAGAPGPRRGHCR